MFKTCQFHAKTLSKHNILTHYHSNNQYVSQDTIFTTKLCILLHVINHSISQFKSGSFIPINMLYILYTYTIHTDHNFHTIHFNKLVHAYFTCFDFHAIHINQNDIQILNISKLAQVFITNMSQNILNIINNNMTLLNTCHI